ncbi:MAG: class I tRNA ligase family protein [Candidatus Paceibacterota bacterium]|jgi:leucyl-tRNA synthetase
MKEYDHKKIEKKWQTIWEKKGIYRAQNNSKKKKFYNLIEFPYPSGDGMHVGHIRSNTAMDIISRKRRMEGFNVLYPIGWDAFGLPTENYAIKTGKQPAVITKKNTDTFRRQLQSIGFSFDWSREINTTDPKYYKWTQWIFLQFFKKGLAYKAKMTINWCPKDKIGLANEEVIDGCCERCGTQVEQREKEQWMLAITKYADRLYKDLDDVDYLPQIKLGQRNWIGKSEGAEIEFQIEFPDVQRPNSVKIFTTRPDTIFGATYLVLAPEHELVQKLKSQITNWKEIENYIRETKNKTEIERNVEDKIKTGVELKGIKAVNPATKKEIPIWIADYVLVTYGTGAIMAVPAHDERDFAFAKKYDLEIINVIEPVYIDRPKEDLSFIEREAIHAIVKHWKEDKYLALKWKKVNWLTFITGGVESGENTKDAAIREIQEETGYQNLKLIKEFPRSHSKFYHEPKKENRFAHFSNFYFQLINDEQKELSQEEQEIHELRWMTTQELEKEMTIGGALRDLENLQGKEKTYSGTGILTNSGKFDGFDSEKAKKEIIKFVGGKEKVTFKLRDWIFSRQRYWGEPIPVIHCEDCGMVPVPEKDLPVELPKVKNYQPTDSGESPLANISKWVNVKCPKCKGKAKRETDTMPNWAGSSWYYLRYTDSKNNKEFASKKNLKYWTPVDWYNGGNEHTTLHLLYSRFWHKFLFDLKLVPTSEPYKKRTSHGMILGGGGVKMSKSLGNVINPDDIVKTYGADTLRLYEMFMGPFNQSVAWSEEAIIGPRRFLERVWNLQSKIQKNKKYNEFEIEKAIKKVGEDIEEMKFNTAVSTLMIFINEISKLESISQMAYEKFLKILSPFAPHITEELWQILGYKKSINQESWPVFDLSKIQDFELKIAVQINGKVKAEIMISPEDDEEIVKKKAFANEAVLRHTSGKDIKKVFYVKNRLINIVF